MRRTSMTILYGVSFVLHASLGAGVSEIEPEKEPERIAISVVTPPKKKEQAKEEPPPPPPPPPPPIAEKPKAARPKAADAPPPPAPTPAPSAAADAPTFGIAMSGGVGMGGVAVPLGDSLHAQRDQPVKRVAQAKTLVEPKKEVVEAECADPPSKPKPTAMQKPEYTEEARAAGIEGKVRVELTVGADGSVRSAKVLESLGYGLDEAALSAVRAASFEPAMNCGKPVEATFVVAIRFSL